MFTLVWWISLLVQCIKQHSLWVAILFPFLTQFRIFVNFVNILFIFCSFWESVLYNNAMGESNAALKQRLWVWILLRPWKFFFGGGGVNLQLQLQSWWHLSWVYSLDHKSSIKPPAPLPPGAYLFQTHLRGTLIEMWGIFNLAQPMVSVLHKELRYLT